MSAVKFILSLARKLLARESKGITTIPNQMAVEQKAGEIAATLQNAGLPLNRADEFIKSEQDLTRVLNMIESTPPVMKEVPSGIRSTKSAKVFNIKGDELDPNKPIIGGTQLGKRLDESTSKRLDERNTQLIKQRIADKKVETEAEIAERLNQENRKTVSKIKDRQRMVDDAIDNVSPGFSGDTKIDAELVAEDLAERMGLVYDDLPTKQRLDLYDQAYTGLSKQKFKGMKKPKDDPENMATGGRAGFKDGMNRRSFLKIMGGLAALPIVGKFFKLAKVGQAVKKVPVIKTADVPGKPEWFDQLVNKVITEGDDMTRQFATKEREIVHATKIDEDNFVIVTQDLDEGAVRVEYQSEANVFGDPVQLQYKKPLPDEGAPSPPASFDVAESGPVGRSRGPDDYEIEVDEVGGSNIRELESDVSKLKEYATGKKLTMKEIVEAKRRRDKAAAITDDIDGAQSDAIIARQGDYDPSDYDDFASGGIARMLGE